MILVRRSEVDERDVSALEQAWLALAKQPGEREVLERLTNYLMSHFGYTVADRQTEHWPHRILGSNQCVLRPFDVRLQGKGIATKVVGVNLDILELNIGRKSVPAAIFDLANNESAQLDGLVKWLNSNLPSSIEVSDASVDSGWTFSYWGRPMDPVDGHPPHTNVRSADEVALEEAELCKWFVSHAKLLMGLVSGFATAQGPALSV